jgi:hypothetical protein
VTIEDKLKLGSKGGCFVGVIPKDAPRLEPFECGHLLFAVGLLHGIIEKVKQLEAHGLGEATVSMAKAVLKDMEWPASGGAESEETERCYSCDGSGMSGPDKLEVLGVRDRCFQCRGTGLLPKVSESVGEGT